MQYQHFRSFWRCFVLRFRLLSRKSLCKQTIYFLHCLPASTVNPVHDFFLKNRIDVWNRKRSLWLTLAAKKERYLWKIISKIGVKLRTFSASCVVLRLRWQFRPCDTSKPLHWNGGDEINVNCYTSFDRDEIVADDFEPKLTNLTCILLSFKPQNGHLERLFLDQSITPMIIIICKLCGSYTQMKREHPFWARFWKRAHKGPRIPSGIYSMKHVLPIRTHMTFKRICEARAK